MSAINDAGQSICPVAYRNPSRGMLRRFLLSASLWLTAFLLVWSFGLQNPMLFLLRASEELTLRLAGTGAGDPITEEPSGDWTFRIPVHDSAVQKAGAVKIRSIDFTMPRGDVILFTFSLPVFWAIMLAARIDKAALTAFFWGTAAMGLTEVILLFLFLQMSAYGVLTQFHASPNEIARWLRDLGTYLIVSVIPFILPIVAALTFHRRLREQFFPGSS